MTNFEYYEDEIKAIINRSDIYYGVGLKDGKPVLCDDITCDMCDFDYINHVCWVQAIKWLYEEYTPPTPKLTKQEHAFCEAVGSGWLARESDGKLWLFEKKPSQGNYGWLANGYRMRVNPHFLPSFNFIQ